MNRITVAAAGLLLTAAPYTGVHAQQAEGQQQQQMQQTQGGQQQVELMPTAQIDPAFAYVAAEGGMAEVQVSQLATQQSKSQQVMDFAQRMIQDHTQTNQQLLQIAQQVGAPVPEGPGPKHLLMANALAMKEGAEFDEAYIKGQIRDHQETIDLYRFAAENARNEQLRGFAQSTLPALEEHLQMARQVAQQLGIEA